MGKTTETYIENRETVMVSGYAPAPRGTSMHQQFGYSGVILEIDLCTDTLVAAEFTFVTSLANDFFARLVQGYSLKNGPEGLYDRIRSRCWTPSTEAIIACVRVAVQRYFDTRALSTIKS